MKTEQVVQKVQVKPWWSHFAVPVQRLDLLLMDVLDKHGERSGVSLMRDFNRHSPKLMYRGFIEKRMLLLLRGITKRAKSTSG